MSDALAPGPADLGGFRTLAKNLVAISPSISVLAKDGGIPQPVPCRPAPKASGVLPVA
jgi:hypothetical protein